MKNNDKGVFRNRMIKTDKTLKLCVAFIIGAALLVSCGSARSLSRKEKAGNHSQTVLTPEQQRKYDYFFLEATRLKAKNEYDSAFELYKHCLAIDPNASSALYEIAQFYLFLNQVNQGQEALEKAVSNEPDNFWYSQALGALYQRLNKKEEGIKLLEAMVTRFPDKQDPIFALLDMYGQQENYEKVLSTLNLLEERIGKSEQISMEKFRIYLQMKDDVKAFSEIESLVAEYPADVRYTTILGDVYLQNGKLDDAYKTYQQALQIEPDNPMALYSMANYYSQTGQTDRYEQQLDTLLLTKKVPVDMKLNIMRQLVVQGEQAKKDSTLIIDRFNRIIEQDTDDSQIPMLYTQYLLSKNMEEEAIPVLEHILQIDPSNTAARMTLLGSALKKSDYDAVIRICKPGIEIDPDKLEFYFYLGLAYYQKEEWDDALIVYKKALEQINDKSNKEVVSDFYSIMGDIYHTKKQMKEAYAAYDSALVYNPNNIGALNNYAYYLSIEKRNLDKAEEMSYKTVRAEPKNSTYLDTYAWILFVKGNYAEARIYIDDAMKNGGDESDVIVEHAGDIYYMTGDVDGALSYWKQAKEMGSESKTLKNKIQRKKYIAE